MTALARSVPHTGYRRGRGAARTWWLIATAFAGILAASLAARPRVMNFCPPSKDEIAVLTIRWYMDEAFPAFRAANPARECPVALIELNAWMNHKDTLDPWGTSYAMVCAGRHLVIGSAGADAVFDSADDVWSHRVHDDTSDRSLR